jgi:hypothetical protein
MFGGLALPNLRLLVRSGGRHASRKHTLGKNCFFDLVRDFTVQTLRTGC